MRDQGPCRGRRPWWKRRVQQRAPGSPRSCRCPCQSRSNRCSYPGVVQSRRSRDGDCAGCDPNRQCPAIRHRIPAVDGQIKDREFELVRIDHSQWQIVLRFDLNFDRRPDRAGDQVAHSAHKAANIDRPGLQRLSPCESEQALNEVLPDRMLSKRCGEGVPPADHCRHIASRSKSSAPVIGVSRLLKSCATPPVNCPSVSIF